MKKLSTILSLIGTTLIIAVAVLAYERHSELVDTRKELEMAQKEVKTCKSALSGLGKQDDKVFAQAQMLMKSLLEYADYYDTQAINEVYLNAKSMADKLDERNDYAKNNFCKSLEVQETFDTEAI